MARIRKRPMTTLRVTDMREQQRADGAQDPPRINEAVEMSS
jgi:hypothetical protein